MSMQASPMEDNSSLLQYDRQSMSDGDGHVPGERAEAAAFFILWGGVFLFILVWIWLGLKSFIQSTLPDPGRQYQNNTPNVVDDVVPKLSRSQRRQRLVKYFDNGKQEVEVTDDILPKKDDECASSDEETTKTDYDDDYDVESNEHLIHLKLSGSDSEKVFPNYCAICLEIYKVGDHVVWSCSPECRHVFHRECLIGGLVRVKDNTSPCPCCRMKFCDFPSTTPGTQDTTTSCES